MRYIRIDRSAMTVSVGLKAGADDLTIPIDSYDSYQHMKHPVATHLYRDVLYPAVEDRDRRRGRVLARKLAFPEPWLVALSVLMWEGIVQGIGWDGMKLFIRAAFDKLVSSRVAPSRDEAENKRTSRKIGVVYSEYCGPRKQKELFIGLQHVYEKRLKRKAPNANPPFKSGRRKKRGAT